jgi:uncharacterized membrane protein
MTSLMIAIALHLLAAVVWVGGMFFAYMAMRPAVGATIAPEHRPALWSRTLSRFFRWVWAAVITLLLTGYWMVFMHFGGMQGAGLYIHVMQGLGIVMMLLFLHVYFAPFRGLKQAVAGGDKEEGLRRIGQIRFFVGLNLILGLCVLVVASAGRYLH